MGVAFGEGEGGRGSWKTDESADEQVDKAIERNGDGGAGWKKGKESEGSKDKEREGDARTGVGGAVDEWMERTAKRTGRVEPGSGFGSGGSRPRRDCIFPLWECRNAG